VLRDLLFIARMDLLFRLRARETLLWVFVMPILFFFFIGRVTGQFSGTGAKQWIAVAEGDSAGFLADQLVHRLEERDFQVKRAANADSIAAYQRRLLLPPAFTDSILAGQPIVLRYASRDEALTGDYSRLRVQRAVYTLLADIIVTGRGGEITAVALDSLNRLPHALRVEVKPAGVRHEAPTGYAQAIPGIMVMFTLLVMGTSGAILLVVERRQGLLRRLAYAPMGRAQVVAGKWLGMWTLGLVQIAFAMLAGTLLFKMDWGPNLGMICVLMLAYGALMAGVGMTLGCLARTEGVAAAIGVIAANLLGALGGCWWPIEVTPAWMQKLQLALPTGWAMDALHKLISFGSPPSAVLWHLGVMVAGTVILLAISARVFRYE
jgi:ABC-type multidrug transport system permease subunit